MGEDLLALQYAAIGKSLTEHSNWRKTATSDEKRIAEAKSRAWRERVTKEEKEQRRR